MAKDKTTAKNAPPTAMKACHLLVDHHLEVGFGRVRGGDR